MSEEKLNVLYIIIDELKLSFGAWRSFVERQAPQTQMSQDSLSTSVYRVVFVNLLQPGVALEAGASNWEKKLHHFGL